MTNSGDFIRQADVVAIWEIHASLFQCGNRTASFSSPSFSPASDPSGGLPAILLGNCALPESGVGPQGNMILAGKQRYSGLKIL